MISPSLFYTKLSEAADSRVGFELVKRWTKNVNIFEKQIIAVPVNMHNHWSLAVILVTRICNLKL